MKTLFFISIFCLSSFACARQETVPRNKIVTRIGIEINSTGEFYSYAYSVTNDKDAIQAIWKMFLILQHNVSIVNLHAPEGWNAETKTSGEQLVKWFSQAKEDVDEFVDEIKPSQIRQGFLFVSISPPGMITYYAEGWADIPKFEPGMATDSIPGYSDLTPYGPGVIGSTIGPVSVPDPFVPAAFIDTIASYKHRALELGWITKTPGIANSLDQKLDNAKAQLQKGNKTAARNILEAFINEVEALNKQGDKMTSEGYALLKYNAEYLIGKL